MTLVKLDLSSPRLFSGPTPVCIEASLDAIIEHDLGFDGEQYDWIKDVLSIEVEGTNIIFRTCWTLAGWKEGRGRSTITIPLNKIEAVYTQ